MRRSALVAAAGCVVGWLSLPCLQERPTAQEVLADVSTAYRNIQAMELSGVATSDEPSQSNETDLPHLFGERDFTAFFSRPSTLLVSLIHRGTEESPPWTYCLALDEQGASTSASVNGHSINSGSVDEALSRAAVVASWVPSILAGLLVDKLANDYSAASLNEAIVASDDLCGGVECWIVRGRWLHRTRLMSVWVAKKTSFIRRVTISSEKSVDKPSIQIDFTSMYVMKPGEKSMTCVFQGGDRAK